MSLIRCTRYLLRASKISCQDCISNQFFHNQSFHPRSWTSFNKPRPRAAIRHLASQPDVSKMYNHVVQIGDPVLRQVCSAVDPKDIPGPAIQSVIKNLKDSLGKFDLCGISACQVGVPLQIFAIEVSQSIIDQQAPKDIKELEMKALPLRVCINPKVTVVNKKVKLAKEYCLSVDGWTAQVPRYSEVSVTYLDEKGEKKNWSASGFSARMIQHEMDHLNGVMFTDKMKNDTFQTLYWITLNGTLGKYKHGFGEASGQNKSRVSALAHKFGFGGLAKRLGYSK